MMSDLLAGVGECRECGDGAHALAIYSQTRPDWVLMDILMPGVDGFAATREIKRQFPEAKILIVTSYDDDELKAMAHKAGACGYLLKDDISGLLKYLRQDRPVNFSKTSPVTVLHKPYR
jgi:DNA-binding NarL/FixJ family response regulator